MPERKTYSIPESAEKLGISDYEINERLRDKQIYCSVRLTGRFFEFVRDSGAEYSVIETMGRGYKSDLSRPVTITNGGGTHNDFVILNYDRLKIRTVGDSISLGGDAELWRINEAGQECIYHTRDNILVIDIPFITSEEIARYRAASRPVSYTGQCPTAEVIESDTQLCDRLKAKGLDVKSIAKELKRVFPEILPSRIGRLLPANPGANVGDSAPRKRGKRLLE